MSKTIPIRFEDETVANADKLAQIETQKNGFKVTRVDVMRRAVEQDVNKRLEDEGK